MFRKILIANRGEIAVRIIRACKELGIPTVAIFSEADREALHVQMADQAVCVGLAPSKDSYLNMHNILSVVLLTKADAVHPGFGFLSESTTFSAMCEDCNIKFIGPRADTIATAGDKANARKVMKEAGVPVIPGSEGKVSLTEAKAFADLHGYPLLVKASAGGGGKGIRQCDTPKELERNYETAKTEARLAFSDDSLYVEKVIPNARHIEVQIIGDEYGNIIHLGERECSMQLNKQKVLEEALSPVMTPSLRAKLGELAIRAARACNYTSAGTVEFLMDEENNFYFLEMNTRIQVEHPITEMITGVDIVKEQIFIAAGNKLSLQQKDVAFWGHSIECRINAKTSGLLKQVFLPGGGLGIRVDSGIYAGYVMPPFYDSMIAKVISHGKDRSEAIAKMKRALSEFVIEGIDTNIELQLQLIEHISFLEGNYHTATLTELIKLKEVVS